MSTLGRKSIKKALKLLRQDAFRELNEAMQERSKLKREVDKAEQVNVRLEKLVDEAKKKKTAVITIEVTHELVELLEDTLKSYLVITAFLGKLLGASQPLLTYVESLESYTSELDEAWDEYGEAWESLSKKMKQAVEELPQPKKEKKPFYVE